MKQKQFRDSVIIGFALFAMFFGAGNLIFPPFLGNSVGDQFLPALVGFLITGIGLPLLGIIACARIDGPFEKMAGRVGKTFAVVSTIILILAIGPIIAIPRTASTTFEIGVSTLFPAATQGMTTLIYFAITLFFVLRPTAIVDAIGKVLTPILLVVLVIIISKGLISPIGEIATLEVSQVFTSSFKEGYQTMDAIAAVIFASIVISSVHAKGYKDAKSSSKVIMTAGCIAIAGLALIYGGLLYLGAQTSMLTEMSFSRTQLLLYIVREVFGPLGVVLLSICATVACLTTAIALLSSSAEFFTRLFKQKVSYNLIAIMLTVISALMATNDVDQIVALAGPSLDIIYPVVIVLIILTLLGNWIKDDRVVAWTIYVTLGISLIINLSLLLKWESLLAILNYLPLQQAGFGWLVPSVLTCLIANYLIKKEV